jgi:hypothetical protein
MLCRNLSQQNSQTRTKINCELATLHIVCEDDQMYSTRSTELALDASAKHSRCGKLISAVLPHSSTDAVKRTINVQSRRKSF